jgi:hypothetical protein
MAHRSPVPPRTPSSGGRSAAPHPMASRTTLHRRDDRRAGAAGIVCVLTWIVGTLLAAKPDLTTQSALRGFLDDNGPRLFVSWLVMSTFAIAWLVFALGVKTVITTGPAGDLFTAAAVAGQALIWTGASLDTAAAAPNAHDLSLAVYNAFGEAAHLTTAAGITATGLALMSLARTTAAPAWPRGFTRGTTFAGLVLLLTGVIGPLNLPVLAIWMTTASVLLLRRAFSAGSLNGPPEPCPPNGPGGRSDDCTVGNTAPTQAQALGR